MPGNKLEETLDGRGNMSRDMELLDQLRNSSQVWLGRTYTWKPWAVSLGKNQSFDAIDLEAAARHGIDVVHRPTGGRAVLHAEELTYCVVARGNPGHIYEAVHRSLHKAISSLLDSSAHLLEFNTVGADLRTHYASGSDLGQACFATSARTEIMVSGRKVVGSAQRVIDGLVLQHGSILCGPAHLLLSELVNIPHERRPAFRTALERASISLSEVAGRTIVASDVAKAISKHPFL